MTQQRPEPVSPDLYTEEYFLTACEGYEDFIASDGENLSRRLKAVSKMAEPIMLLVMGGVVGLLVSSLILPIFKLSRAVG